MEDRKECVKCGETKLLSAFSLITKNINRRRYECKQCSNKRLYIWKHKNFEHMRLYRKKYAAYFREKHPLVYKSSYINRRFGKAGIAMLEGLYHAHPYCEYCGIGLSMKETSIDHALPISRGGSPDKLENLVISCFGCNQLKGTKTSCEFKTFLIEYTKRLAGLYLAKPEREGVEVMGEIIPISTSAPLGSKI